MNTVSTLSEFLNKGIPTTPLDLVKRHERLIEILDAIKQLERRKKSNEDNYYNIGKGHMFPNLAAKYKHRHIILKMAIARIWALYYKELKHLNS